MRTESVAHGKSPDSGIGAENRGSAVASDPRSGALFPTQKHYLGDAAQLSPFVQRAQLLTAFLAVTLVSLSVLLCATSIAVTRYPVFLVDQLSLTTVAALLAWFAIGAALGLSHPGQRLSMWQDLRLISSRMLQWGGCTLALLAVSGTNDFQLACAVLIMLISIPVWVCLRLAPSVLSRGNSAPRSQSRLLIVGSGQIAQLVAATLIKYEGSGSTVVGFVDDSQHAVRSRQSLRLPAFRVADIEMLIREKQANHIVFAFSLMPDSALVEVMRLCQQYPHVRIDLVPRFYEVMSPRTRLLYMHGLPLLRIPGGGWNVEVLLKNALDRTVALLGLIVAAPLLLVAALAIRLEGSGPIFYRQERIGQHGTPFWMYKLRTMRERRPGEGEDSADRYTRVGAFLRKTSIDELPQLWNVLRGEMSVVGPRPERGEYVKLFSEQIPGYARRHRVRGGLTGLAQVKGLRGATSIVERARLDNFYIDTWSFWSDIQIILLTFTALIPRSQGLGGASMFLDLVTEVAQHYPLDPLPPPDGGPEPTMIRQEVPS